MNFIVETYIPDLLHVVPVCHNSMLSSGIDQKNISLLKDNNPMTQYSSMGTLQKWWHHSITTSMGYLILSSPLCSSALDPMKRSPSSPPAITLTCLGRPILGGNQADTKPGQCHHHYMTFRPQNGRDIFIWRFNHAMWALNWLKNGKSEFSANIHWFDMIMSYVTH